MCIRDSIIPTCHGRLARLSWLGGPHYTYLPEKVGQAELTWWPSLYLPAREGWPGWVNLVVLIIRTCQRRLARLSLLGGPQYTYLPEKVGQAELTWWPSLYLRATEGWPGWVDLVDGYYWDRWATQSAIHPSSTSNWAQWNLVSWEFNVYFQHKYGYIRVEAQCKVTSLNTKQND